MGSQVTGGLEIQKEPCEKQSRSPLLFGGSLLILRVENSEGGLPCSSMGQFLPTKGDLLAPPNWMNSIFTYYFFPLKSIKCIHNYTYTIIYIYFIFTYTYTWILWVVIVHEVWVGVI